MRLRRPVGGRWRAPEFPPLDWLNTDRPLTLKEPRGKVVVLDFWTYGCINCMHVIPELRRLEAKHPHELVVVGVHSAESEHEAETDNGTRLFDFGDADGVGDHVRLQHPLGIVYRHSDGLLYVADTYSSRIKTADPETREVRTRAGGDRHGWRDGEGPLFCEPGGIDAADGKLYVADTNNHVLRVINLLSRETLTLNLRDTE